MNNLQTSISDWKPIRLKERFDRKERLKQIKNKKINNILRSKGFTTHRSWNKSPSFSSRYIRPVSDLMARRDRRYDLKVINDFLNLDGFKVKGEKYTIKDLNKPNLKGLLPIEHALDIEDLDLIQLLLENGADLNIKIGLCKETLIERAILGKNIKRIKQLLSLNVDISKHPERVSPLELAFRIENSEIIELIIQKLIYTDPENIEILRKGLTNVIYKIFQYRNKSEKEALVESICRLIETKNETLTQYLSTLPAVSCLPGVYILGMLEEKELENATAIAVLKRILHAKSSKGNMIFKKTENKKLLITTFRMLYQNNNLTCYKDEIINRILNCPDEKLIDVFKQLNTILSIGITESLKYLLQVSYTEEFSVFEKTVSENLEKTLKTNLEKGSVAKLFQNNFAKFRDPTAILRYTENLFGEKNTHHCLAEVTTAILQGDSLDQIPFKKLRYSPSEHLDQFDKALLENWKNGVKIPLSEFNKSKDPNNYTLVDSDDANDLLLCGTEILTCQSVDNHPVFAKCLLSYLRNGKNRILAIKDSSGRIVARSIIRLLLNDIKEPVLFLENVYTNLADKKISGVLLEFAKKRAAHLKLPLLSSSAGKGPSYQGIVQSLADVAPYEYVDSQTIEGGDKIERNGGFIILKGIHHLA